jgi:7-carboxy-7-deazaguanine synthase
MYPVADIFRSVQGEGHFVGYPMTFVRLAGCSVSNCAIRRECDEAPWKSRWRLSADDIISRVGEGQRGGIVCITGGEPTDHDLLPLVSRLHEAGFRTHLETSGARSVAGIPIEWITVSPKSPAYLQRVGHTMKVVVRPDWPDPWMTIAQLDEGTDFFHRYMQPLTGPDGRPVNLAQVSALILDRRNDGGRWALSTQAHRSWGLK